MATTFANHLLGPDTHANRPAAGDVPSGTLYSCSDHSLIYQSDGSTWSTWATLGGGGASYDRVVELTRITSSDPLTNGAYDPVNWNSEVYDPDGWHDNATNPSRLTVPAGTATRSYLLICNVWVENLADQQRAFVRLVKNGTADNWINGGSVSLAGAEFIQVSAPLFDLAAGDYVEVAVFSNGSSVGVVADGRSRVAIIG
jgi:hypothetical protein